MSRRSNENKGSWSELILFFMIILCIYFILALFDSSFSGEGGREWGKYLRNAWGGAVIVPLLFWLYLCTAKLLKFRVPRVPRQVLGTIQLYISFAFLLGLLRETGWNSEATLFIPGSVGSGLAKFFVLNVGTFITLLLVIASFLFSAFLFGSKIFRASLPQFPSVPEMISRFRRASRKRSRKSARHHEDYEDYETENRKPSYLDRPENILFSKNIPVPNIPVPTLKPAPIEYVSDDNDNNNNENNENYYDDGLKYPEIPNNMTAPGSVSVVSNALEIIDNALAMIDSGELKAPEEKRKKTPFRPKKMRRPLPAVTFPDTDGEVKGVQDSSGVDESVFPPPSELFGPRVKTEPDRDILKNSEKQAKQITSTLKNFGINATVSHIITGASVIQYQLELAPGTKVSKISGLSEDLSMSLAVMSVRIEAPILGTHYVGIEIPAAERKIIALRNIVDSSEFQNSAARLPIPLGTQIDGKISVAGLEDMPHILIAGAKGSGRSMFVNSCILSMCSRRRPEELKLILIDPKHVDFAVYDGLPHLLASPVYEPEKALNALKWAYSEMEKRTADFASLRVRNLASFNRKQNKKDRLPEIVIVINELSDIVYSAGSDIEGMIMRLAQKSGASGIYMMIASQRPSPDVFTTMIKSNIPARAVFSITSDAESRNIIGTSDAMRLTGRGDMLFRNTGNPQPVRLQAPYVSEDKISDFVEYMMSNLEPPKLMTF